nr:hypothetical protein [Prevotella sp. HJM029]
MPVSRAISLWEWLLYSRQTVSTTVIALVTGCLRKPNSCSFRRKQLREMPRRLANEALLIAL